MIMQSGGNLITNICSLMMAISASLVLIMFSITFFIVFLDAIGIDINKLIDEIIRGGKR